MERNDPCWCGSGVKWKKCHYPEPGPEASFQKLKEHYLRTYKILLKTPEQIEGIRNACTLTAAILDELCKMAKEGVTTNELDRTCARLTKEAGAIAAPLNYGHPPYPKSICTSLNDVVCHGIPDDTPLKNGDILNIDVSCLLKGYFGDTSRMVMIGTVSPDKKRVVETAYEGLEKAISLLKPGVALCEIGNAIEKVAHAKGCSVVHQFVGHGVGVKFHEAPQVLHYANESKIPLAPGMTFTIEPMINAGAPEAIIDPKTGWIAKTRDGSASAQWEHTVLITETGCEVLTRFP